MKEATLLAILNPIAVAQDKMDLYMNRFYLLHQRLRRMKMFSRPVIVTASVQSRQYCEVCPELSCHRGPTHLWLTNSCSQACCSRVIVGAAVVQLVTSRFVVHS